VQPAAGPAPVQIPDLYSRSQLPAQPDSDRRKPEPDTSPDQDHHYPGWQRQQGGVFGQLGSDRHPLSERPELRLNLSDGTLSRLSPRWSTPSERGSPFGSGRICGGQSVSAGSLGNLAGRLIKNSGRGAVALATAPLVQSNRSPSGSCRIPAVNCCTPFSASSISRKRAI